MEYYLFKKNHLDWKKKEILCDKIIQGSGIKILGGVNKFWVLKKSYGAGKNKNQHKHQQCYEMLSTFMKIQE